MINSLITRNRIIPLLKRARFSFHSSQHKKTFTTIPPPAPAPAAKKHKRPMVHLSSAPNQKFTAKSIGSSHPIVPHEITPRQTVPDHITKPCYAMSGKAPPIPPNIAILQDSKSIDKMRNASQLAAKILHLATSMACEGVGVTTNEIDIRIHEEIINAGGYPSTLNYQGFRKSLCTSVNEVACHGIPDLRPLEFGGTFWRSSDFSICRLVFAYIQVYLPYPRPCILGYFSLSGWLPR